MKQNIYFAFAYTAAESFWGKTFCAEEAFARSLVVTDIVKHIPHLDNSNGPAIIVLAEDSEGAISRFQSCRCLVAF